MRLRMPKIGNVIEIKDLIKDDLKEIEGIIKNVNDIGSFLYKKQKSGASSEDVKKVVAELGKTELLCRATKQGVEARFNKVNKLYEKMVERLIKRKMREDRKR